MTLENVSPEQVEVVMATYNGAPYVEEQIESILAQDYPAINLIISDDGSTDGTRDILEDYARKRPSIIKLLPYGENLGVRGNFSRLLEHSTARYVFLSDQDDVWDNDKISRTLGKMKELEATHGNETPLIVHTDLKVVDKDLCLISPSFWKFSRLDAFRGKKLNRLLAQNNVTGCATLINRPLMKLALPIPKYCSMHDWWLALVGASFGCVEPLPTATISYRQHGQNAVGAKEYKPLRYFIDGIRKLGKESAVKREQAKELLRRFDKQLTIGQKKAIHAYVNLPRRNLIVKAYLIVRHRLFRSGLFRNLASLFEK